MNLDQVYSIKESLFKFNEGKASSARFTSHYSQDYIGTAVHGFNIWEQNPHCTYIEKKSHKNQSCNGFDAADGCTLKFMSSEAAE